MNIDKRDLLPFSVARIPHIEKNITQNMFDSAIKGEFLRKSCSILSFGVFIPKKKVLLQYMKQQDFKRSATKSS